MSHWADQYVGLPAQGLRPCWALVRKVWIERLDYWMPSFDGEDDPERAVAAGAQSFVPVAVGQEREFDAVMMNVPMRDKGAAHGFRSAETHIGVVVSPGLVLHVEKGKTSVIDGMKALQVSRILRGPWAGGSA